MSACPNKCKTKYNYSQHMELSTDEQGLPVSYKCPRCEYEEPLTLKQKMLEIIYRAQWFFGVPEHCDVDEYYFENEDETIEKLLAVIPSVKFVRHIQSHLKEGELVMCKICDKTIEEIIGEPPL